MAQSWRLKTVEVDNTEKTTTSTPIVGATVIVSPKGPNKFVRFNKGDTQGILNTFGYPSKDYPSIQDALDIVNKCSMYIASPYDTATTGTTSGAYGGVFVTSTGTVPFGEGIIDKTSTISYSNVPYEKIVAIASSTSDLTFEYDIPFISKYVSQSLKLYKGDSQIQLTFSGSDDTETFTNDTSLDSSGNSLNKSTGKLNLKFISGQIAKGDIIKISYDFDVSDTYFILMDKNKQEDDLRIKVLKPEDYEDDVFEIYVERENPVNNDFVEVVGSPFLVGLLPTSKDSYGDNIYINNIFGDNQQMFDAKVVTSLISSFTDDENFVHLEGGSRGDAPSVSDIASIYDQLKDTSKYQIKFCFDATNGGLNSSNTSGATAIITKFEQLRTSYQKRCRFLYCTANVSGETIVSSPNTYNYGITANRGMYQYCLNWGTHVDVYQGNDFICSNMGLIAGRLVDALNAGTGCPAWIDENGVGGILGSSIVKLSQEGTAEDVLQELDDLNFNAVVNDYTYGAMIVGWRTRQVKKTVYSNIPQSSLADTIIELIIKEVLPSRIGKLIDEATYSVVRSGVNTILSTYSNFLEDYYVWCDSDNNTPETRENEQLIVTVGVSFKNYARTILLTFIAEKNGVNVEEALKNK